MSRFIRRKYVVADQEKTRTFGRTGQAGPAKRHALLYGPAPAVAELAERLLLQAAVLDDVDPHTLADLPPTVFHAAAPDLPDRETLALLAEQCVVVSLIPDPEILAVAHGVVPPDEPVDSLPDEVLEKLRLAGFQAD